jgi:hypothetical protein
MRCTACALLLGLAVSSVAQEPLLHDFRDRKFDRDVLTYSGRTPEKYIALEKEGLRLRYTGNDAPPSNNTAGVAWRFHARGDFVVTAKYEILHAERPKKGWAVGAELYLRVKNPNKDGVSFSRILPPAGEPLISFTYMTNGADGKRFAKFPKQVATTDRSLRGAFRVARQGTMLIASFAEADDEFKEFQRAEIGNADIDLIRFAGLGGGDPNAVLDMRMLDFNLQGKDLGYNGRDFATPAPKAVLPAAPNAQPAAPIAQVAAPIAQVADEPTPSGRRNVLLLIGVFFMLVIPLVLIGAFVLFMRLRERKTVAGTTHAALPRHHEKERDTEGKSL